MTFKEWMKRLDLQIEKRIEVSIYDLPDQDFRSAYRDGITPSAFAREVVAREGF